MRNSKLLPYLVGVPNLGVGLLWAMNLALIPMLVERYTTSEAQKGFLVSMGAFTGMFVQYLVGIIGDRSRLKMGKRLPFMLMGSLATTVFLCMMPFASSYWILFGISLLFYFSLNFYQGAYYAFIPEAVSNEDLGVANGFARVISVLGLGFIFAVGTTLWNVHHSIPFIVAAALGLFPILLVVCLLREDNSRTRRPSKLSFDFLKYPSVLRLYLAAFLIFSCMGSLTPYFFSYSNHQLGIAKESAERAMLLFTLLGAAAAWPLGKLSDRVPRQRVFFGGVLLFALSLAVGIVVSATMTYKIALVYVVMSCIGVAFIAIQITLYALLTEISPRERLGEFMGVLNFFISLSQLVMTNVMGWALDSFGRSIYFPVAATLMGAAVVVVGFSRYEAPKDSALSSEDGEANPPLGVQEPDSV